MRRCVLFVAIIAVLSTAWVGPASAEMPLPAPTVQSLGGYNSVQLTWTWTPNASASALAGFEILRTDGESGGTSDGTSIARVAATQRTYTDAGLSLPTASADGSRRWRYSVVAVAADGSRSAAGATAASPTAAVAGQVTDSRGVALGGVRIRVNGTEWQGDRYTSTAADGSYLFDHLSADTPALVCFIPDSTTRPRAAGYLPECWDDVPLADDGTTPVPLTVGVVTTHLDAALASGAAFAGVVRDQAGRPLRDTVVFALDSAGASTVLTTNSTGGFSASALPPGRYEMCAYDQGQTRPRSSFPFVRSCLVDAPGATFTYPVVLSPGVTTPADIVLVHAGTLSGRLVDISGAPVVGASVAVSGVGNSYSPSTDAGGEYSAPGLTPGAYTVCWSGRWSSVTADGTTQAGLRAGCAGAAGRTDATPVQVASSRTSKAPIIRAQPAAVTAGRVLGPDGSPLAGVVVLANFGRSGVTEADGRYRISVPAGSYSLCFDASRAQGASSARYLDSCWDGRASSVSTSIAIPARGRTVPDAVLQVSPS